MPHIHDLHKSLWTYTSQLPPTVLLILIIMSGSLKRHNAKNSLSKMKEEEKWIFCSHKTHRKCVFSILNNVGKFVSANKIIELQPLIPDLEHPSCELCLCDDPALMCSTLGRWSSQKKWNTTCAQMLNICRFVSCSSRVPACIIFHKLAFGHHKEKHTSRQL